MRLKRILIIGTIFPVLFSIVLFFGILISGEDDDSSNSYSPVYSGMNLSADVLKHQPMVEKYARENGISEYVNVLLAIIQVESGGTATDVMQSSESLGLPPNSLSTEESIKQGCKYFASLLSSCKAKGMNDINVVIQSYNYGGGYADYVAKNGKKHSFNLAENFAKNKSGGTKVTYTNPIAVSKNGGWRYNYGNMFYVELVNQYLTVKQFSNETVQAVMNEALKYQGWKYVYGAVTRTPLLTVLVLPSGATEKPESACHEPHRHSMTQPSISPCHRHRLAIWSFSIPLTIPVIMLPM